MSIRYKFALIFIVLFATATGALFYVLFSSDRITVDRELEWSIGIYQGASLDRLEAHPQVSNPVLTARDVTDVSASFVADPFMVEHEETWYMFFEVMSQLSGHGEIGLAVSPDCADWTYHSIVLDEPFHLSFPFVFRDGGDWYMIPESATADGVRIYRTDEFPNRWEYVRTLVEGKYSDSVLFQFRNRWWLLTCSTPRKHDELRLFTAESLRGDFTEHPVSPVVRNNGRKARPAGRVLLYNGIPTRFAQDSYPTYGKRVHAFAITELSQSSFAEGNLFSRPVVDAGREPWNRHGMHHVDPHQTGAGTWVACVDGYRKFAVLRVEY